MERYGRQWVPGPRHAGVTVIELLVTLSILVVLMTIAVPGLSSLIAENRRVGNVNQLLGALNMARSEAIRRGLRVTLCKTRDPYAVAAVCDGDASWEQGWILFVDNSHIAGNRLGVIDGTDQLLRVFNPLDGLTINTGANYAGGLSYVANGRGRGITARGRETLGTDTFVLNSGDARLCIAINLAGRPSLRRPGQRSCT